jgi:16S rRNA processing protein RimM
MVVMGRVTAPFGVQGWVKIHALTAPVTNLCRFPVWWLERGGEWRPTAIVATKAHTNSLVARLEGIDDREGALALRGTAIAVPRDELPAPASGEFYWADLIGLSVKNTEGHVFGEVADIMQTGANDVLVVGSERETLIPFISGVIRKVDLAARTIDVDWGADY